MVERLLNGRTAATLIRRKLVRQITNVYVKQMEVMVAVREQTDVPTADDRHGAIALRLGEDMLKIAQRARDELVAINAADATTLRN